MDKLPPLARRIDHVAVAVRSVESSMTWFVDALGLVKSAEAMTEDGKIRLAYFEAGDTTLQLVEPLGPGPLADFLDRHGEGLHHICFSVEHIASALACLDGEGDAETAIGGRGLPVCFLDRRPSGVLIELTEMGKVLAPGDIGPGS